MDHRFVVDTFKQLSAGLGTPVPAGEAINLPDWDGLGRLMAEGRMFEHWVRSLPAGYQAKARRSLGRRYTGRPDKERRVPGGVVGFGVIDPADVAQIWLTATIRDTSSIEGTIPVYWDYRCRAVFVRDVKTGSVPQHWGGIRVDLFSPFGQDADPPEPLVAELLGLLADAAVLSGALCGGGGWAEKRVVTVYRHPRGEMVEPEVVAPLTWITLFGPQITERLGGVGAVRTSGVFHEVREVPYLDGRTGALVRICERASAFDHTEPSVVDFLRPVLPP